MTTKTWMGGLLGTFAVTALLCATGCVGSSGESSGQTSSNVNGSCSEESDDGAADKVYCAMDTDCDSDEVCMDGKCTGFDGEEEDADTCEDADDDEGEADKVVCATDADCDSDERCVDGKCD